MFFIVKVMQDLYVCQLLFSTEMSNVLLLDESYVLCEIHVGLTDTMINVYLHVFIVKVMEELYVCQLLFSTEKSNVLLLDESYMYCEIHVALSE